MTNTEIIQAIKAEIERLKKDNEISEDKDYAQYELDVSCGYDMALDDVLDVLSTLESEKPMQEGLEEEIIRFNMVNRPINHSELSLKQWGEMVARHFAEWGAEHLKK